MRQPILLGLAVISSCLCQPVQALDASAIYRAVQERYRKIRTLSGDFTQTICSHELGTCQVTRGQFWYSRPGRFRFEVNSPVAWVMVSDGEQTWQYWPDSNLVRRQPDGSNLFFDQVLGDSLGIWRATAAARLGDTIALDLEPADSLALCGPVRLSVLGPPYWIVGLTLTDFLGNEISYRFYRVKTDVKLPKSLFVFSPPKEAGYDE
ncbi:MAG: outer membrane lipoprotein carrier protein LolA [candidate division WOR-3 bacterium]